MRTDPRALAATHHDLLIVGGGIHGLFIAYDAATRGMSVALVEQADFGSGLSFNHQRTIHGGLREIGRGRISKARRQMFERRRWAQMAPHLIRPVPFVLGASGWTVHSRAALAAGLRAYEWVGRSSQSGVPRGLRLPRARLLSAVEMQRMFPDMPRLGGGALWHDYQTRFPDRLNFTVAMAAAGSGARLANYAPAVAPLMERGRVAGARVRDLVSGDTVDVTASVTLLAAGSGLAGLASTFGVPDTPPFVRAMNMLLDRPAPTAAFAATGPSGRVLTIVPWHGYALVGTYQSDGAVDTAETAPPSTVIDEMVAHVNATFPALTVRREDIRLVHHGLAPAEAVGGRLELKADAAVVRCAEHGAPGLLAVIGVKFTSARAVAEQAVNAVAEERQTSSRRCVTGLTSLPHAGLADREAIRHECDGDATDAIDDAVLQRIIDEYGTEAPAVVAFSREHGLVDRLTPDSLILSGEIAYAAERSAAVHLADVVHRRTTLGAAGHPGHAALTGAARIMASLRRWTPEIEADEIRQAERRFIVP